MSMEILTESIVVRAAQHNPSILSPLFLRIEGIVPEEWRPDDGYFSTPPLSVVKYPNGVEFLVDNQVLQISRNVDVDSGREYDLSGHVLRYIKVLPHTPYSAIGINFEGLIKYDKPEVFLMETFLKNGKWNEKDRVVQSLLLTLVYQIEKWKLSVSFGSSQRMGDMHCGSSLVISANFHLDVSGDEKIGQIEDSVAKFSDLRGYFVDLIRDVLPIKD